MSRLKKGKYAREEDVVFIHSFKNANRHTSSSFKILILLIRILLAPVPIHLLHYRYKVTQRQDCIPVECILPACWPYLPACTAQGGVCSRGPPAPGGCLLGGRGACSGGSAPWGCLVLGGGIPTCTEADPPVNRMTQKYYLAPNFVCGRQ